MIDANSKTNSFLEAIEKYAEEQKSMMIQEIEDFREEQLRKADEEGTAAAFAFIQKEKAEFKTTLAREYSLKETGIKRQLFAKRNEMVESIFADAEKKLVEFTKTDKYAEFIISSAKDLAECVGDSADVVVSMKKSDSRFEKKISELFSGSCIFAYDNSVKIGGISCYCESLSIVADNTLDSRFENCKKNFVVNSRFMID